MVEDQTQMRGDFMKKILMAVFAVSLVGFIGCTKCSTKKMMPGETQPMAMLTADTVGNGLAPAICEKYSTCNPSPEFNKEQCLKDIGTGITENLKQAPNLNVDQAKLSACAKVIQESACEVLNSTTPPVGCEFLQ